MNTFSLQSNKQFINICPYSCRKRSSPTNLFLLTTWKMITRQCMATAIGFLLFDWILNETIITTGNIKVHRREKLQLTLFAQMTRLDTHSNSKKCLMLDVFAMASNVCISHTVHSDDFLFKMANIHIQKIKWIERWRLR